MSPRPHPSGLRMVDVTKVSTFSSSFFCHMLTEEKGLISRQLSYILDFADCIPQCHLTCLFSYPGILVNLKVQQEHIPGDLCPSPWTSLPRNKQSQKASQRHAHCVSCNSVNPDSVYPERARIPQVEGSLHRTAPRLLTAGCRTGFPRHLLRFSFLEWCAELRGALYLFRGLL